MQRSEYLGVYHNTNDKTKGEVPFRAAIRLRRRGQPDNWVNLGYMVSERVAARVYNMYAINFFGKGAIINKVDLTPDEQIEFEMWLRAEGKEAKRMKKLEEARNRAHAVLNAGGRFKTHLELRQEQAKQERLPV